ncbi:MAG: hypothetical protein AAB550_00125 [Patescibacteria group bacterium]
MDDAAQKAAADLDFLTKNPVPTLSQEIVAEFGGKEREPIKIGKEIPTHIEEEPNKELVESGHIERVETAAELKTPVMGGFGQPPLVQSANPQNPKIKLPLTDDQIKKGLHHHVWEAIRWLAVWCTRQIDILKSKHD